MENKKINRQIVAMDGNTIVAHIAYAFTEVAAVYPISPSTEISELVEALSSANKKNLFGSKVSVFEFQSEGGSSGGVHGALQLGSLATTFTASQGLLLMIPNIYKWKGEMLPAVIHVPARSIASRTLSIMGDHQDIYAVRQTGAVLLCSHSVEDCARIAPIAHGLAITGSCPVIHFYDGLRTSSEIQKVDLYTEDELRQFLDLKALEGFRTKKLDSETPTVRGGAENDDTFFQALESQNAHYNKVIDIAKKYLKLTSKLAKKRYAPFVYYGDSNATRIIIAMGSVTETIKETVDHLNKRGEKVGVICVYLYRPFSVEDLLNEIPQSVKSIAVLDRTKEQGAPSEPLYLDVVFALKNNKKIKVIGGRFGLSSKNTSPAQIVAVFNELKKRDPKTQFTIGIIDDVTNLSLETDESFLTDSENLDNNTLIFWGLGGDGTISANRSTIKIIAEKTNYHIQGYFLFDSLKSGGLTRSFLRFSKKPIRSTYFPTKASFVSCNKDQYLMRCKMVEQLKDNGTFLLNTSFSPEEVLNILPNRVKYLLAVKKIKFYIIDAGKIAREIGIPGKTSTIMQSAFFKLNENLMKYDDSIKAMKYFAEKAYGSKGRKVVEINFQAIDLASRNVFEVKVDPEWANLEVNFTKSLFTKTKDKYIDEYVKPIFYLEGNEMPVSKFQKSGSLNMVDGSLRSDSVFKLKRKSAEMVPRWIPEKCIQCNRCAIVCPHATIRAFLLDDQEILRAPKTFESLKAIGAEQYRFRIQVNAEDCVGCSLCATECPVKALEMVPINEEVNKNVELTEYLYKETTVKKVFPITSFKGEGFLYPYFENSGACPGCGETPYYKMLTQLFGKDMIIANATGCSSIYGGSLPYIPFATDRDGEGPAWANSLFEDNAEFGYGMHLALRHKFNDLLKNIDSCINDKNAEPELVKYLQEWKDTPDSDREKQRQLKGQIFFHCQNSKSEYAKNILNLKTYLVKKAHWIIGGDGWAYDIGYGGLDHILASGSNLNIFILDTQVYSNTGGQASKSTDMSAVASLAAGGKGKNRKDLGKIFMSYKNIYVAQICMGANINQSIKAMLEAENYDGPSIVIAYSPCIAHGIQGGMKNHQKLERDAVSSGYWPIYRYDPRRIEQNLNPLQIDYKPPKFDTLINFLLSQQRYKRLADKKPKVFAKLFAQMRQYHENLYQELLNLSKTEIKNINNIEEYEKQVLDLLIKK
ncbi:pyruvate:ferredoxin (flavodoxin) oxidoreductase [Mycoplasma sp. SG1]|uniref:pyruvate:ferredoxin (flavodoxin) oxidoreductase n=1 Tax=Mycoplasma sp. SG1 TaxID=2810348 RepID=UPI002025A0E6|nr:pyruvate:ferredoxin (flavodoxin) oxidoreductase [Mycoplasma sp. SG1]URM52837.1 pyruvate:ferredoxin (flavodoxin) oxidoreductase [Mycoplasma sp. SG1]